MVLVLLLLSSFLAYWIRFKEVAGSLRFLIAVLVGTLFSQFFLGKLLSVSPLISFAILFFALPWAIVRYFLNEGNRTSTDVALLTVAGGLLIPFILVAIGIASLISIGAVI